MEAKNIFDFLEFVDKLKHLKRTGWLLKNINDCETVSGHMYNMAIMTFFLNDFDEQNEDKKLNRIRCMEMALVHDIGEAIIGDITPNSGISKAEKHRIEDAAVEKLSSLLGHYNKEYIKGLFNEYNNAVTEEAKFVKQLDKFDLIFQAFQYEKRDNKQVDLNEFYQATEGAFSHPFICKLVKHLHQTRNQLFNL